MKHYYPFKMKILRKLIMGSLLRRVRRSLAACLALFILLDLLGSYLWIVHYAPTDFVLTSMQFVGVLLLGVFAQSLAVAIVFCRKALHPLEDIIVWAKTTNYMQPLTVPEVASHEVISIYEIINKATAKLDSATQALLAAEKNNTMAITVQMLAHDIRKPFAMMQALVGVVSSKGATAEAVAMLTQHVPTIDEALASIDAMLNEILDYGKPIAVRQEAKAFDQLLASVLKGVFSAQSNCHINFTYQFAHTHLVAVDSAKIRRLMSNIIVNALDAMDGQGDMYFLTHQEGDFIKVSIRNSDSVIPPARLAKVFDLFYTSKRRGNGLGLAICKKIVESHGGTISCESSSDIGTTLIFTLPVASQCQEAPLALPRSSEEIRVRYLTKQIRGGASASKSVHTSGDRPCNMVEVIRNFEAKIRHVKILLIDDDLFYRNIMTKQIATISPAIGVQQASSYDEALQLAAEMVPDIVILDIDLGTEEVDGFDLLSQMRNIKPDVAICVHTNHITCDMQKKALDAHADLVLPKPLTRKALINFIYHSMGPSLATKEATPSLDRA